MIGLGGQFFLNPLHRILDQTGFSMEIEAKFLVPDEETLHRLEEAGELAGYDLSPAETKNALDTANAEIMNRLWTSRLPLRMAR